MPVIPATSPTYRLKSFQATIGHANASALRSVDLHLPVYYNGYHSPGFLQHLAYLIRTVRKEPVVNDACAVHVNFDFGFPTPTYDYIHLRFRVSGPEVDWDALLKPVEAKA